MSFCSQQFLGSEASLVGLKSVLEPWCYACKNESDESQKKRWTICKLQEASAIVVVTIEFEDEPKGDLIVTVSFYAFRLICFWLWPSDYRLLKKISRGLQSTGFKPFRD